MSISIYTNVGVGVRNKGQSLLADRTKVTPLAAVHMTDYPKEDSCKADTGGSGKTFPGSHAFNTLVWTRVLVANSD